MIAAVLYIYPGGVPDRASSVTDPGYAVDAAAQRVERLRDGYDPLRDHWSDRFEGQWRITA
jgi:cyclopropane fatty-acyl-phospholipid synthase-like methyltransferase